MTLSQGDRLGRYEVLGPIGAGGMGEVWRARDTELGREVAVKVLPESFADDATRLERFQREAKALAALSHPNLLDIYDVGSANGLHYAVTELLEGDTLRERITPTGLPWKKVTEIGAAVADGLAAAHGRGIIHRDLKPENLFLTADGRVKILDFGLAAMHEEAAPDAKTATITEAGTVMGTPGYMSPEQVKGQQADARSDIFGFGCVLYEMVSGHRAFGGDTGAEVIASILKEEPPQLSSSGAAVPVDLERAVHRCLEKRSEARFQSAADLAYSLRGVGQSGTAPVMATLQPSTVTKVTVHQRLRWQIAVVALLVVIAAGIGWQALRPGVAEVPVEVATTLDPNRIAVVPFTNRTGDASLDGLVSMTADRLIQGFADLQEIEVAPASVVAAASAGVEPALVVGEVATTTDSGLVLTGVWDAVGAGLELQATLEDAQRRAVVRAFDPIPASRTAPQDAIATLRDWTLMAVQDHLHDILSWGAGDRFPVYAAYREYRHFIEAFESGDARSHIFKALSLDPDFARPFIQAGAYWSPRMMSSSHRRVVEFYQPVHDMQLTPDQQRLVGMIDRRLEGQWEDAFRITREELDRNPEDSIRRFQVVRSAGWANRPWAAIEAYKALEFDPLAPSSFKYDTVRHVCDSFHRLEKYDEELALIRDTVAAGPLSYSDLPPQWLEVRALIGLGRIDEVDRVVSGILVTPQSGSPDWQILRFAADELRVHGFPNAAQTMADKAVAWWDDHPEVPRRTDFSQCLMSAGRVEEAWTILDDLMQRNPESRDSQYVLQAAGVCAARLGDRTRALDIETRLAEFGEEDLESDGIFGYHGVPRYRSAQIAARLGEHDRAINLLQQAVTAGFYNYLLIHRDSNFEALWDHPEFQEIMRPKG